MGTLIGEFPFKERRNPKKEHGTMIGRKPLKQLLTGLLSGILILTACAPSGTATPVFATQESTVTPSPIPAGTNTFLPTATPTASITPLPTIPTFTPTFDASTILTVSPATKAECPKENPAITEFATPDSNGFYEIYSADDILTYLNSGGTLAELANWEELADLTGDGLSEVVYVGIQHFDILGCKDGKYQNLFELATYDFSMELKDVLDLNKDGIPELIFYSFSRHGFASVYIVGWDGNKFRSLIDMGTDTSTGTVIDSVITVAYYTVLDTNGDGLKEVVIVDNLQEALPDYTYELRPLRNQTITLGWNGKNFVDLKQGNYAMPRYRFQAIQDGDWQVHYGNYAAALSFYQEAIFNDQLEWWSPERKYYESYVYLSHYYAEPIVTPSPIPDNTEYPRLAAYAYYRIMLLHIVQGHESDAGTVYKTLQQKFGDNPYGQPYAEMATAFWETYQSTYRMYDGCAVAIQYAAEHPEILTPLGTGWDHGTQSHTYEPVDVCPFR